MFRPQNAILLLLVIYCVDSLWKWSHWAEYAEGLEPWMLALALSIRLGFMAALFFGYRNARRKSAKSS